MSIIQSIFLGIVQGLTEFLPVSSSGHLAILQNIFNIDTGSSILFDVLLHLGTLIVIFVVFWKDIWQLICEFFGIVGDLFFNLTVGKKGLAKRKVINTNYRKFVILLLVSTIPTGLVGVLGSKLIKDASETLIVPGICLLITAALLYLADRAPEGGKTPEKVTYREGIVVGIAQGLATLPGLSRSGTTLSACLMCGMSRTFAVRYTFILSIPAVLGATVLEVKDIPSAELTGQFLGTCAAGVVAAAVVGYVCIRFMIALVQKKKYKYFSWYCLALGIFSIIGQFVFM